MATDSNILNFAVRKFDAFEIVLKDLWKAYCAATDCQVKLRAIPMDLPELHKSILTDEGLKNGSWDLALISSDWLAEACQQKALLPLNTLVNQPEYFDGWPPSLLRAQFDKGLYYGVPFHDGPECLIYRKDLFDDPSHGTAFQQQFGYPLEPPKNWTTFLEVAQYFQQPNKAFYGAGLAAFPDGHNAVYDFCIQVWSRGGEFIDKEGNVNFLTDAAIDGLQYYRALAQDQTAVHSASQKLDSVALGMAFAGGEIAMMINWFGFATYAQLMADSKLAGKIGVAPIPHQLNAKPVAPNSYWVYGIGSGSEQTALAMDFIQFATDPSNDVHLTLNGGVGCRKSTWKDPEVNQQIPFFHQLESLHSYARELPAVDNWPQLAQIIDQIMTRLIQTDQPVVDILNAAQQQVTELPISKTS